MSLYNKTIEKMTVADLIRVIDDRFGFLILENINLLFISYSKADKLLSRYGVKINKLLADGTIRYTHIGRKGVRVIYKPDVDAFIEKSHGEI